MRKVITYCIPILIPILFQIIWEIKNANHKELTIEECRNVPINNIYGNKFSIYYLDSIKVDNKYSLIEYRITNTGNTTILGFGDKSDILTELNRLPITNIYSTDLKFIQLIPNKIADLDEKNRLVFKQWKPEEYIDLICLSMNDSIINISDRDIKDVSILHKKTGNKITRFGKLSKSTKWTEVICYSINLIIIILYLFFDFKYIYEQEKTSSSFRKQCLTIIKFVIWIMCLLYTFSLPIRWIL